MNPAIETARTTHTLSRLGTCRLPASAGSGIQIESLGSNHLPENAKTSDTKYLGVRGSFADDLMRLIRVEAGHHRSAGASIER